MTPLDFESQQDIPSSTVSNWMKNKQYWTSKQSIEDLMKKSMIVGSDKNYPELIKIMEGNVKRAILICLVNK